MQRPIELISLEELDEIRRIWVEEKGEIEDLVSSIYQEITGQLYPGKIIEPVPLEQDDLVLLQQVAAEIDPEASDELYKLMRTLLAAQFQAVDAHKRSKHLDRLESILKFHSFRTEAEALQFALADPDTEHAESPLVVENDPDLVQPLY